MGIASTEPADKLEKVHRIKLALHIMGRHEFKAM